MVKKGVRIVSNNCSSINSPDIIFTPDIKTDNGMKNEIKNEK